MSTGKEIDPVPISNNLEPRASALFSAAALGTSSDRHQGGFAPRSVPSEPALLQAMPTDSSPLTGSQFQLPDTAFPGGFFRHLPMPLGCSDRVSPQFWKLPVGASRCLLREEQLPLLLHYIVCFHAAMSYKHATRIHVRAHLSVNVKFSKADSSPAPLSLCIFTVCMRVCQNPFKQPKGI